jgi:hypothetical protein
MPLQKLSTSMFDPTKPFHPFILAYQAAVHGTFDLLARRAVDLLGESYRANPHQEIVSVGTDIAVVSPERFIIGSKTPLLTESNPRLGTVIGYDFELDVLALESEFYEHGSEIIGTVMDAHLRMLILACWAVIDKATMKRLEPTDTWQFFRHCRNAAAHNGHFRFDDVPKKSLAVKPVHWSGLSITVSMEGDPLFANKPGGVTGFLRPADIIKLLYDVEQLL